MSEPAPDLPDARDQIAGLTFALLLVRPDMTIAQANPAAESLFGHSARRLDGQVLYDLVQFESERIMDKLAQQDGQLIARGIPVLVEGREVKLNMTVSPLQNHEGWRSFSFSDAKQGERFEEDERGRSLRGPAVLAHEIKNPLAAIKGAAQLLARKIDGDASLTSLITDEVDRIAALIDRMQRLGRSRAEPIEPLNLHAAIHRAVDTVSAARDGNIVVEEEFDPSLPPVLGNEGALVQVLINLISNAADAAADSKQPRVRIRTRFVSGLVMNVFRLGRPVKLPIEVQVSDNGAGIDPSVRDEIFEPFVSSKKNGQGLGLALVQKLLRDMDGRITHERDDASGWTHFRVHLPMAKQPRS